MFQADRIFINTVVEATVRGGMMKECWNGPPTWTGIYSATSGPYLIRSIYSWWGL